MEKTTATKLIEGQRRHSHSQESDTVIARSAERAYLNAGGMFVGIAFIDLIDSVIGDRLTTFRISFSLIILVVGAIFCWQGYRFRQIRKLLADAKTDSH
jgi:hypothetical protein